jgi:hypothetical protein
MLVGLVVALVAAQSAHAATVSVDRETGTMLFVAAPGEANRVALGYDAARGEYTVRDDGAPLTLALSSGSRNSCRDATVGVACTALRITAVKIDLGDLDDTLSSDVDLPVSVDGGTGADMLGCGVDVVVPDPADAACDSGGDAPGDAPDPREPAGGAGGLEIPTGADGTPVPAPDLVLPVRPVTLGAPGVVEVHVGCAAEAAAVCSGDIYVEAPARLFVRRHASAQAARGRHSLRQRRLGHRRFRVVQGETVTTPVPVLRGHYVMRNRRKRVRGRVLIVQRDASGKVLGTASRPVVLERKWSRRGISRRRR